MDKALQKTTRRTPGATLARPTQAPRPPKTASEASAATALLGITQPWGASAVTTSGNAAPTEKLLADARAACNGLAEVISEMPNSSRACAPSSKRTIEEPKMGLDVAKKDAIWPVAGVCSSHPDRHTMPSAEALMTSALSKSVATSSPQSTAWELLLIFLRLGLTSFGGPAAHLGYFRHEFVERRKWLDEHTYTDIVALCQFLPGPGSSQVGIAIGRLRGGIAGAIAAWLGFTLPSVLLLIGFAYGFGHLGDSVSVSLLHGLKLASVAVVAQAVWSMGRALCPDRSRATIALVAASLVVTLGPAHGQIAAIVLAGAWGALFLKLSASVPESPSGMPGTKVGAIVCLTLFISLLLGLPVAASVTHAYWLDLGSNFYRVGSLVFGGGHVVLPLLQAVVVPRGWVSNNAFLAGYGAAQAIPGPLFSFAAFLGAMSRGNPSGLVGALIATVAIFLPSFLLVGAALPLWGKLRAFVAMRRAMASVNAAVVGILLAALYEPVWTNAVHGPVDFCVAAFALLLLTWWRFPSWAVVLVTAAVAFTIA
jgi:chromate transporter